MTRQIAEKLAGKWIVSERKYRARTVKSMASGSAVSATSAMAHADQLRECRRELQTAFGLGGEKE